MILLIDGYNLIFTGLGQSAGPNHNQLEALRDNLVRQLKSYNLRKKLRIIVVFDGDRTVNYYPQEKESGGVRTVFSQDNASADEHIINLAASYIKDKSGLAGISVVTSDRDLARTLEGLPTPGGHRHSAQRIKVISSESFAAGLNDRHNGESDGPDGTDEPQDPPEKLAGLNPADVPKWLKIFKTTDDTDSTDD